METSLDRSHRLGARKNNGKSRPIMIKFVRYNTRCRLFKKKKKNEGKKHKRNRKFDKKKTYEGP